MKRSDLDKRDNILDYYSELCENIRLQYINYKDTPEESLIDPLETLKTILDRDANVDHYILENEPDTYIRIYLAKQFRIDDDFEAGADFGWPLE